MSLIKILTPDFHFEDERGVLTQLVSSGYEQVNAVFTHKGAVRGSWHYHQNCTEAFFVISGSVKFSAKLGGIEECACFGAGDMFAIGKNVAHNLEFNEDTYMVVLYDKCVENPDGTKDIHTL